MTGNAQVMGLLEEILNSGKTPEEVCRDCPELLPEVRRRWQEFCLIDAQVGELLPGLRTPPSADAAASVLPASDVPPIPASTAVGPPAVADCAGALRIPAGGSNP